jgi:hypothetical protein
MGRGNTVHGGFMKKLLAVLLLVMGTASSGCIIVDDDGRPRHTHCIGCGHVYVKGHWR